MAAKISLFCSIIFFDFSEATLKHIHDFGRILRFFTQKYFFIYVKFMSVILALWNFKWKMPSKTSIGKHFAKTYFWHITFKILTPLVYIHRKKRFTSFPSPAKMSLTKLPLGRNNSVLTSLFPPRESLVVSSRLGTGNSRTFFYGVRP